jgi:Lon protease-like protein
MSRSPFDPPFEDLPRVLPIFPLSGALLLPGGRLPLNVFEPRYLNMIGDALAGDRMIGMVQPYHDDGTEGGDSDSETPEVYRTGCAGRLISFAETDDGRYLITLQGLIRFAVGEELPLLNGYRRVVPDYGRFRDDLQEQEAEIDRDGLMSALRHYFEATGVSGDWEAIEKAPNERLVTTLAMGCPFEPPEKQALLEAGTLSERSRIIIAMLEMAAHGAAPPGTTN